MTNAGFSRQMLEILSLKAPDRELSEGVNDRMRVSATASPPQMLIIRY